MVAADALTVPADDSRLGIYDFDRHGVAELPSGIDRRCPIEYAVIPIGITVAIPETHGLFTCREPFHLVHRLPVIIRMDPVQK